MGKVLSKFLMTLAATTVSIVLTFGTTAIVDRQKKKAEKREMVLMIMFDMRETLTEVERCDGELKDFFNAQLDVVAHPEKFDGSFVALVSKVPVLNVTTTTESIFRSNIETIRTIGNILFVQAVSSFYDMREQYGDVVEDFQEHAHKAIGHYEVLRDFDSPDFAFRSELFFQSMRRDFEQCKLMMKVTDKELDVFSVQQEKLRATLQRDAGEETVNAANNLAQRRIQLEKARDEAR